MRVLKVFFFKKKKFQDLLSSFSHLRIQLGVLVFVSPERNSADALTFVWRFENMGRINSRLLVFSLTRRMTRGAHTVSFLRCLFSEQGHSLAYDLFGIRFRCQSCVY